MCSKANRKSEKFSLVKNNGKSTKYNKSPDFLTFDVVSSIYFAGSSTEE